MDMFKDIDKLGKYSRNQSYNKKSNNMEHNFLSGREKKIYISNSYVSYNSVYKPSRNINLRR
jgi:hypothetical protein